MTESLQREIRTLRELYWSSRDPDGRAFASLADAYRRYGDLRQSMELLREGLDRLPDFVSGHVVAARLYCDAGMMEEASFAARRALELDPENVEALRSLAWALEARGEEVEAAQMRGRARALEQTGVEETPEAEEEAPDHGAELAPAEAEEEVVSVAELAPDETEEEVVSVAELAPDAAEEEAVSVAELAPDAAEEEAVSVAELAPDAAEEEAVSVAELAPDAAEEEAVSVAELAPDEAEEEAVSVAELAPDAAEEEAVSAASVEELAPEESVSLQELEAGSPSDAPVEDLTGREPTFSLDELEPTELTSRDIPHQEPAVYIDELAPDEPTGREVAHETAGDGELVAPESPPLDEPFSPMEGDEEEPRASDQEWVSAFFAPDTLMEEEGAGDAVTDAGADDLPGLGEERDEAASGREWDEPDEEPAAEAADEEGRAEEAEPAAELVARGDEEDEEVDEEVGYELTGGGMLEEEEAEEEPAAEAAPEVEEEEAEEEPAAEAAPEVEEEEAEEEEELAAEAAPEVEEEEAEEEPAAEAAPEEEEEEAEEELAAEEEEAEEPATALDPLPTRTLADLYARQGLTDRALAVYRQLLQVMPGDAELQRRIDALSEGRSIDDPVVARAPAAEEDDLDTAVADSGLARAEQDELPEVDTPFAWTEAHDDEVDEAGGGAAIGDYFGRLLSWGGGDAGEDAPDDEA